MKEEKFIGLHLTYPEDQDTGDSGKISVSLLMSDWEKHLGQVVKGRADDSYYVITGISLGKTKGLTVRFLNPYYELIGRPRDLTLSANQSVSIIKDQAIQLFYKDNLKKIREEIQIPEE
jgi:hypothetical protein